MDSGEEHGIPGRTERGRRVFAGGQGSATLAVGIGRPHLVMARNDNRAGKAVVVPIVVPRRGALHTAGVASGFSRLMKNAPAVIQNAKVKMQTHKAECAEIALFAFCILLFELRWRTFSAPC